MKTKKAYIIERILCYLINILFLPITLVYILFYYSTELLSYCLDIRDKLNNSMSHKLFLLCDERDVVKNKYVYDRFTVRAFYQWLKNNKELCSK